MAIRVALHHKTRYDYDCLVTLGPQIIRLRPAPHTPVPIVGYSLKVEPEDHFVNWQQDPNSNYLARLAFHQPTRFLEITVDLVIDLAPINPFDFFLDEAAEEIPFTYEPGLRRTLQPFLQKPRLSPLFKAFVESVDLTPRRTIDFLVDVNSMVNNALEYSLRMDPGIYTPEQTLKRGVGSCRDFAWLLVQVLRRLGIAARFVSGYSIQIQPDEKPIDPNAPAGVTEDICDLHAWCEAYLPGAGWVGMDPTSGLFCGEGHIPLATSASAQQAAPIEGGLSPCKTAFDVTMSVTRVHEDPRVTLPLTEGQWTSVLQLGDQVDEELAANDVRLSMGGEPTFVSMADQAGDEWNTEAVGPTKKPLSDKLIRSLRTRMAPGGLLHFGQGKWYPGEPLPRWALGLYWRKDGVPIWGQDKYLGSEDAPGEASSEDAERLAVAIAEQLVVDPNYVQAAFEDPVYYSLRERNLPINLDPFENRLDDPEERSRLLTVFERGLDTPTGFILPVKRTWYDDGPAWQSGMWMLRGRIFLAPGDSPVGLRLPLKKLPWMDEEDSCPYTYPSDPTQIDHALPPRRMRIISQEGPKVGISEPGSARFADPDSIEEVGKAEETVAPQDRIPELGESAPWVIRTALCVEVREGRLYVFLPPVDKVEDFLELIAAVEYAAESIDIPVLIEGYPPPTDPRIEFMKVTPDPGVIEVNIHPSHSWRDLVGNTEMLYQEARKLYLGTDKYQLDGRHTGTGGGNHMVLGGATPVDSPFLRRPDLLKSVIGFWLNHPSLSYLFSGLFIGPTSQAPRLDEGRIDASREMELAFRQVPRADEKKIPLWLVDRIFRHLLTDLTGNTHRAEICIDKLYSPDGPTGRLGLVEFRGFEMPPHPRMSLTQQLLLRSLVAHFWQNPYEAPLEHLGLKLHDQYLLPHFVVQDFKQVIDRLNRAGYAFQTDWFRSQIEFRFPVVGTVKVDDIHIEVRQAIEPWLVLGEEAGASGTARYVDSSLERVQVKVTGLDPSRHVLTVNCIEIPLTPTGEPNTWVAGVRFRAWQPPNCLHPTIPVHSPLIFDVVDRSAARSIGGCSYYISHPGGRSHENFPVNALEAETRRAERFLSFGHTPGPLVTRPATFHPAGDVTLDLRRHS